MLQNKNLAEVAQYQPELLTPEVLIDLLTELEAWRNMSGEVDTPEEAAEYIEALEESAGQCNNEDHCKFDAYKEFFDDCVRSMEDVRGSWPCAEPWDNNLRNTVLELIERGCSVAEGD